MKTCEEWKPFVAMVAIDFAFAILNLLLKKVLDEGMDHLVLITYRLVISTTFLAPIAYFWERDARLKLTFRILCYLFISAILGASITQYFFLVGIQYTSATFSLAFLNMVPVVTFVMAIPFSLETVNMRSSSGRAKILGTIVCIGGALLITLYKGKPLFHHIHSQAATPTPSSVVKIIPSRKAHRWTVGCIALILGTLFWSSWFLLQSNISKRYPCQYSSTTIMTFFGAIQAAIISFCSNRDFSIWVLKGKVEIITVSFAGMIGSGLCFVGMSWCVKKRGPLFTAAFSPLVQIMAAAIDIPLLHEQLYLGSLLGSLLIMIGLYVLLWGKNKEIKDKDRTAKRVRGSEDIKEQDPPTQTNQSVL